MKANKGFNGATKNDKALPIGVKIGFNILSDIKSTKIFGLLSHFKMYLLKLRFDWCCYRPVRKFFLE